MEFQNSKNELRAASRPEAKFYVEIHILARISNRLSRSGDDIGGELSVENISFAVIPIEDHEQTKISIIS